MHITIDSITKSYQQGHATIRVLNKATATFVQGQTYAITGSSGSGKSTLLHIIASLESYDQGTVTIGDRNIGTLSAKDRTHLCASTLGIVFQQPHLINELSVIENIMLKGLAIGTAKNLCYQQALSMLDRVNLSEKAHAMPATLSGGQQQRIAILRALFNKPAFLLADEPTGNLDQETGKSVIDFLLTCQRTWNMGLIVCSHDQYVIQHMQTILHLKDGVLLIQR